MGIFSFLFKKKKVNNIEEPKANGSIKSDSATFVSTPKEVTKDHQDICDFLLFYENYKKFINQDDYISVKNTKAYYQTVSDKLEYLKKLDKSSLLKDMCKVTSYDTVIKYIAEIENITSSVDKHNDAFIEKKKIELKKYLDDILKECDPNILLDNDQRNCVLSDEDYSLVIAGAGAGKTTTVAAKIKYLVDIKKVNPKDILVVSFTNKAVGELRERVNEQLKIDCPITTFHSTGIAIIKKDSPEGKITPVNEGFLYNAIRDYLQGAIANDSALLDKMILLFASYFEAPFEEGDLKDFFSYLSRSDFSTLKSNLGDYNQQIIDNRTKRYYTIQDERVNSKQEVQIANFLYMNNIDYTYEPTYPFYIEGSDKYYTPDFFIKQGDRECYIEHFALSEEGKNSRFTSAEIEKYKKAVHDKVAIHKKYKTNLLYTFSKYNDGRDLLSHLEEKLINAGFVLNQKSSEEIFNKIKTTEENKYIAPLIKLIQT